MKQLAAALEQARLTPTDLAWFEREKGRRFAPLPPCKLRKLAKKAGFTSSKEYLDWYNQREKAS